MDKIEDVNWSAWAQRAFEKGCNMNEVAMPEDKQMQERIEQLRASKEEYQAKSIRSGKANGVQWAMLKSTTFEELEALANLDYPQIEEGLAAAVCAELEEKDFWEHHLFTDRPKRSVPTDDYVTGFLIGVSDIYNAVADKL